MAFLFSRFNEKVKGLPSAALFLSSELKLTTADVTSVSALEIYAFNSNIVVQRSRKALFKIS